MRKIAAAVLPLLSMLTGYARAAGPDSDYGNWQYSYHNIDVTAVEHNEYTVSLARYCARLDILLTRILHIETTHRPVVHIYALPEQQVHQWVGADNDFSYHTSNGEVTILIENGHVADSDYYGAYYGYTAALLEADDRLRGPEWYQSGLPLVFANTRYRNGRVSLGNLTWGYALQLGQRGPLIPMKSFLNSGEDELIAAHAANREMYDAQSWALAHEVFIEGWHRAEFDKYLDLLRHGSEPQAAFTASFTVSYETLNSEFAAALHHPNLVYNMTVPDEGIARGQVAQPVSPTELKAREALLSVRFNKGPDAVQLTGEVLQSDPANETALRAQALAEVGKGDFAPALVAAEKLSSAPQPSSAALADSAKVLERLAKAVQDGKAVLARDAAALRSEARGDYERILSGDPENRGAREGLARLSPPGQ